MEILGWLVPSAAVTVVAMAWATWAGRPRRDQADRSEAAYARFSEAITNGHPQAGRARPQVRRDRSTGIAVRPSRGGTASRTQTRRSA
ncbi:MAG: hypothetical protein ACRDOM_06115 [Nocardioides sp.]